MAQYKHDCAVTDSRVELNCLTAGQIIGRGTFSQVYVVQSKMNQVYYALKVTSMEAKPEALFDMIVEENKNHRRLSHPHIIEALAIWTKSDYICNLMELMVHRSCDQILSNQFSSGFPENAIGLILNDILGAVEYLHNKKIVHCTIKASHIFIASKGQAVLSGFRFMTQIPDGHDKVYAPDKLQHMTKYLNWLSPEVLAQDKSGFNCQSDIYSIGILVLELANGVVPYAQVSPSGLLVKKLQEPAPRLWDRRFLPSQEQGGSPSHSDGAGPSHRGGRSDRDRVEAFDNLYRQKKYSQEFVSLVDLCLIKNPAERPNCSTMMNTKFMKTYHKPVPPGFKFRTVTDPNVPSELLKLLKLTNPIKMEPQEDDDPQPWQISRIREVSTTFTYTKWNFDDDDDNNAAASSK